SRWTATASPGRWRRTRRSACTFSARALLSSQSRFVTSAQYRHPATARTTREADPAYHTVRRAASDHARRARGAAAGAGSGPRFEDIAHPPDGVDQLLLEGVVHLGAEAADVDLDDVEVAVEVHVPDLLGDERPRQHLAGPLRQQRQQGELLGRQVQAPAGPA